jgi:BirA family transcriptional regulator, biotin operon repressor / biotin---[acetyl-CoA-carboxylase] ligase
MASADRLDPDKIAANLKTKRIGRTIVVHDRTSSTNDIASEYARNAANDGLVVFAEEQTAGRGRTGATWQSAYGDSLLFSVLLIRCGLENELLSLTCAVAVAEALGQIGGDSARVKWPNDVMLSGRKIAGILVESKRSKAAPAHIIGIGINCHQGREAFPPELRETAISIDSAGGTRCNRTILARRVLASLDHWLAAAQDDRRRVLDTWNRLSTQRGQRVTVAYNGRHFTGNCIGVDPEKGLILQLDRGGVRMFDAAHTSIVKNAQAPAPGCSASS